MPIKTLSNLKYSTLNVKISILISINHNNLVIDITVYLIIGILHCL